MSITNNLDEIEFKVKDRPLTQPEKKFIIELLMRLDSNSMESRLDELRHTTRRNFFDRFLLTAIRDEFQSRSNSDKSPACCIII